MTDGDNMAPPPPPRTDAVEVKGGIGGRWMRATYPMGRLRASVNEVHIWFTGGELWPSIFALRGEVEAIEYRRGPLGGVMGSSVWVVLRSGQRPSTRFISLDLNGLIRDLARLGWPIRQRT
jgi:hypothetical protein